MQGPHKEAGHSAVLEHQGKWGRQHIPVWSQTTVKPGAPEKPIGGGVQLGGAEGMQSRSKEVQAASPVL